MIRVLASFARGIRDGVQEGFQTSRIHRRVRRAIELGATYRRMCGQVELTGEEWWAARNAFFGELAQIAKSLGMHQEAKALAREDQS